MAYQKDTANTVAQAFDKFLAFCCLHGGFTRLPDSGTIKSISKGNVRYDFDTSLKYRTANYNRGFYITCRMSINGVFQPIETYIATWTYEPPFVAIDMFANNNDCYLVIELSNGVFTQLGIGKVVDLTQDVTGGWFLVANGAMSCALSSPKEYYAAYEYDYRMSSFFNTPNVSASSTNNLSRSYIYDEIFKETQTVSNTYFCGHLNSLTDSLIIRTPASNILRHTSPPLYYVDKNAVENTEYVKGYVYGCRPCQTYLLQPRDVIIDNWMMFPLTSVNDNSINYPSCEGRGYLFYTGD